jgi:2',3'-cyclic-nucleotide 2'-phosphodiesterase/3'-nucleotidase
MQDFDLPGAKLRLGRFLLGIATTPPCADGRGLCSIAGCLRRQRRRRSTTPVSAQPATATLAVLETTDLHFNVRSYDYFKLAEDKTYSSARPR